MFSWLKKIVSPTTEAVPNTTSKQSQKGGNRKEAIEKFKKMVEQKKNVQQSPAETTDHERKKRTPPEDSTTKRKTKSTKLGSNPSSGYEPSKAEEQNPKPTQVPTQPSIFNNTKTFTEVGLEKPVVDALSKENFFHPSEIQEISIQHALKSQNLVCSSPTGSGKTLAFVAPTIQKLRHRKADQVLVLAPTREIAIQIENCFKLFTESFNFTTGLIIGGTDMLVQKNVLKAYPNVLIATPGRLVDVMQKGLVWLNYTSLVILDEVDLMLDMGFEKELNLVFNEFQSNVQLLAYTATLPEKIKSLLKKYISEYQTVVIGKRMETKKSVEHKFIQVNRNDKLQKLVSFLDLKKSYKLIVFFNTIDETIKVFNMLRKKQIRNLNSIHSRKTQEQRNQAMEKFRNNSSYILLATDIASRGIDIPEIDFVVNYNLPNDPEDYVHRIGRTGRADQTGKAITFFDPKDKKENVKLNQIKKLIKSSDGFQFINKIEDL